MKELEDKCSFIIDVCTGPKDSSYLDKCIFRSNLAVLDACFISRDTFKRAIYTLLNGNIENPVGNKLNDNIHMLNSDNTIQLIEEINICIYNILDMYKKLYKSNKPEFIIKVYIVFDNITKFEDLDSIQYIIKIYYESENYGTEIKNKFNITHNK